MNELTQLKKAPTINVEGIKKSIVEAQEKAVSAVDMYSGLTDYKDMKDAKAKLNGIVKDIDETRKGYTRDLDEFKKLTKKEFDKAGEDAKALADEYKEAITEIDEQEKQEKRDMIANVPNYNEYIQYFDFNDKWLNKSYSITDVQEEIKAAVDNINEQKTTVHEFANAYGLDSEPYMKMLTERGLTDITAQIKQDHERLVAQERAKADTPKEAPKPQSKNEAVVYSTVEEIKSAGPTDIITVPRTIRGEYQKVQELRAYADKIGVEWLK